VALTDRAAYMSKLPVMGATCCLEGLGLGCLLHMASHSPLVCRRLTPKSSPAVYIPRLSARRGDPSPTPPTPSQTSAPFTSPDSP